MQAKPSRRWRTWRTFLSEGLHLHCRYLHGRYRPCRYRLFFITLKGTCMVATDHAGTLKTLCFEGEALHKKHFKNLGAGGQVIKKKSRYPDNKRHLTFRKKIMASSACMVGADHAGAGGHKEFFLYVKTNDCFKLNKPLN